MEKTYNPQIIETGWYRDWEEKGYFAPTATGPAYCIMLPPPNVTGSLHMGHAFQQTLMDVLIRYHRMSGFNTLWQCGTDHAGIATQMVVERQLEIKNTTRHELGRERFTEAVWQWKETSGNTITRQSRRLGTSMDWSRERFTLDEGLSAAVTEVFIRLYDEGLIYRGKRLVNWDPVLHTAISDLEVISAEEDGQLWHMRYPRADGKGFVVVATTRPETMLGDAAVAVHPDDERYRDWIGQELRLPLANRTIPIIADDYVDPEFGTGCVKITPAHDFNDYAVGQRHDLALLNIFTIDARINDNAPMAYQGLDRFEARRQIVADLEAQGLLEKIEPHKLMVPRGDRSHAVVEPYLTDQWYVKIQPLAEPAIRAVETGAIRFVPDNWSRTYFEWMRNIEDWCISRQLWWGHRIPAWYDQDGNIYVGHDEQAVRQKYKLGEQITLDQDPDVLDTWFSSALWPFSTLGWPGNTAELQAFYPTSVLVTGFDIIFFWVARMIMMGLKFMGDVPFREVYIHGLIRDSEGQKMSKSKGNILDPLDLIDGIDLEALVQKRTTGLMHPQDAPRIEKLTRKHFPDGIASYGTDSLRFTFASLATQGRDIRFDVGRIQGYRNFCNKLWNAARYVLMSVENQTIDMNKGTAEYGLAERWITTRLAHAVEQVTEGMRTYRFDLAAQAIYEFTWDEYCDWYLELSKTTLSGPGVSEIARRGTLQTLVSVLEILLRLMHPFIPFITEELWQRVAPILDRKGDTIMLQAWPGTSELERDETALPEMEWVRACILGVRRIRAERDIAPGKPLAVQVKGGSELERTWLTKNSAYIKTLARIESIKEIVTEPDDAVVALAGAMTLLVPLADLIDLKAELERLEKELDRLNADEDRIRKKLGNSNFVARAPEEVVRKERERLEETAAAISRLKGQHVRIRQLADA
ncbi:MAG: valine--tRNA ligase [Gammaproteobacteria bacterium RBG_16_51_14]|nr:MAG: valine--tRNA ligase [Gammaproteobacteria bacterium RBG_16_51_14]